MNKTENYHYISDLLLKEATGTLTDAEQQELNAWKADDAHREQLSAWMRDYGFLQKEYRAWKSVDVEKAVHEMEQRIQGDSHEEPSAKKSPQISYLRIFRYAAAVLILVVAGAALWYSQYTKVTPPEISEEVQTAMVLSVKSGKQDANIVSISEALSIKSEESEGSEELRMKNEESFSENASDHSSLSSLHSSLTKDQLLAAKRITTRHDKEFWVTLDDGTLVHLNYNTRLIYPEKFGRGDRNVILDGEAYFMVAKDKSRPFIVHTPDGDVRVYGTEFNVNSHGKDGLQEEGMSGTTVVLVKGSVSVTPTGGNEVMMNPGQQLSIHGSQLALRNVDVEPYIAWNIGKFDFREWTLERIMSIIGRWYGYEVEYGSKTYRNIMLSGDFDRYNDISTTLEALEAVTELRFAVKNGKIIIQ